ncbi:MAG TPA: 8-amino-7-oxononanoate synthase [Candidatus Omnitrophota bacterium]|nr:8-amino-7-oxononanoate synthase [Candidatus Omnitrophota bacterium]HPS36571.1 8-amino-7-oxononanoate synthase [Candidatus Omnitrophota bacterium]
MLKTFQKELENLAAQNLYRKLRVLEDHEGTRASFDGRELLLFCGNDYLGLSRHPRVVKAAQKALEEYGVGAGAARLISGTSTVHRALEEKIAQFKGKESALVFATGFLANLGILTAFAGEKDVVIMDKLCHASLVDGARLAKTELRVFPHKNYKKCEEILKTHNGARRKILVTETVFSMDGDLADLKELVRLKEKYGALLMVDDAHGTGVLGANGRGATEGFSPGIDIIMGTLSKAVGGLGGFVAADKILTDYLVNLARPFIFATALPPVLCEAAREAFCVIEEEPAIRQKLWENIRAVESGLKAGGFVAGPAESAILPVILGDEKKALVAFEKLLSEGLFIPAVRFPTVPKGKARLRITVSASHTSQDIRVLLTALQALS